MKMKILRPVVLALLFMLWASRPEARNMSDLDQETTLSGTWRGKSICEDTASGCHDEEVVYRMVHASGSETVSVDAGKIVDGKVINMGPLVFTYDKARNMLSNNSGRNSWQLVIKGKQISGVLLRDGAVFRNVALTKDK
jgi:hypothetical protein